jgi:urease accessory protein
MSLIELTTTLAHTGHSHGSDLLAGLTHPLFGVDHLLAMVTVGLLAVQLHSRKALWLMPATFVGSMLGGGLLAAAGVPMPGVEHLIALSVIVLGLLVAVMPKLSLNIGLPIVGAAAIFHGYAHVAEIGTHSAAGYFTGMLLTTAALHAAGVGVGLLLTRQREWPIRIAGAAVTMLFAVLLILP